jgi:alkylhydroperoxidase family enzyme
LLADPSALTLPPRQRELARLASLLAETPWAVRDADLERLRAAGLRDEAIVQAVTIVGIFSHLTRMADATGIELDYESPLPRLQVDRNRGPVPRPDPARWPVPPAAPRLPLALRPNTAEAMAQWRLYIAQPGAGLSAHERAVVARAAAYQLCDARGLAAWGDARPETPREQALAAFAEKLTLTPWRMTAADLAPLGNLQGGGLDDRGILAVVALVGFQNMDSRVRLALALE